MRLIPSLTWALDGDAPEALDERLLPLLEAIGASQSLASAVAECGVSYRAGWGLLRDYHRKLGVALVTLERGRGASLTQAGERLLSARRVAARRLARILPTLAVEIGPRVPAKSLAAVAVLRIAASHDLALAALAEALPDTSGVTLELSFMGSLHAIKEFAEGRADIAGFHVALDGSAAGDAKLFASWLRARRDRLIRFVDREQGLIVPRGNPGHIRNFRDVAARGLRFVNRQRGSGTRLIIDQLLHDARIDASDVNGYHTEEFTHAAIAATVASGGAEAGFGLRAAAAEYQLGFVSLVRERYFLAVRAKDLDTPAVSRFIASLRGAAGRRAVRAFAGYRSAGVGTVSGLGALDAMASSEARTA